MIYADLNDECTELFTTLTADNVDKPLALVIDGEIYSAPIVNEPIPGGQLSILVDSEALEAAGARH